MAVDQHDPGPREIGARPRAQEGNRHGKVGRSLSPSRAADFKSCPLLYRFRSIDRLPEPTTPEQARGTLVHAVLERLFDLPAQQRTPQRARQLVEPQWRRLTAEQPDLAELFGNGCPKHTDPTASTHRAEDSQQSTGDGCGQQDGCVGECSFLESARTLLDGYFTVEDPQRLAPAEREALIEATVGDQLLLRGYVDRLDRSPAGDLRVVDYKTGSAPREAFEAKAMFQLKFYALVLWRARGIVPKSLRLLYLKDREARDFTPDDSELARFERTVLALWKAIERATETGDFRPTPSKLCQWCAHQSSCPQYGGTPPPYRGLSGGTPPADPQLS